MNAGCFTTANASENAAKAHQARRQAALERQLAAWEAHPLPQTPIDTLRERADELNELLSSLKRDLRDAVDSQDKLRLCQAIDKLEQSWARYAGIPTPPKARPQSRRTTPAAGPLE